MIDKNLLKHSCMIHDIIITLSRRVAMVTVLAFNLIVASGQGEQT